MSIQNMIARKTQCNYRLNRKVLHMKHCVDEVNSVLDALCAHGHKPKPMPLLNRRCHSQSLPGQSRVRHHASRAVHSARRQSRPVRMAVSLQNLRHHPVRDLNRSQNRGQDLLCLHTRAAVSLQSRNQSLLHHPVRDLNRIQALALANLTERSPDHTFDIPDHAAPAFSFRRFAFNEL